MAATNSMKDILDAARNSDLVKALAAGSVAQDVMATTDNPDTFSDAASALGAAFDTIKASILTSWPHVAHAVATHQAKMTGGGS